MSRQRFVDILAARAGGLGVEIRYEQDVRDTSQLPDADLILAADGVNSQLRGSRAQFSTRVTERTEQVHLAGHRQGVGRVQLLLRADGGGLDLGPCLSA